MLECKECGVEVAPVVKASTDSQGNPRIWGKGDTNQGKYFHTKRSTPNGTPNCGKFYLTEDEITDTDNPGETEVLVQN